MNNQLFPEEPVTYADPYAIDAYVNYLNWNNKWQFSGNLEFNPAPITQEEFALGDQFIIVVDLNGYPKDPDVINPIGNDNSSIQMQLDLYIPTPLAETKRLNAFIEYHRQVRVTGDGNMTVTF